MSSTADSESIVISVGGSLIVPDAIDTSFLQQFRGLIESFVDDGKRFFIVAGGGKTCRRYQAALEEVRDVTDEELDWIGIRATRLNGHLMIQTFGELACADILHPLEVERSDKSVTVSAGLEPGCSTDYRAVQIAEHIGAAKFINLSNIDYVYTKDPKRHDDAEKITETDWSSFRELLPSEWDPGLNTPFDPVAAQKADELSLEVAFLNGEDPENIRHYINQEEYGGTVIRP